jgi:hypothetical protein
VSSIVEKVSFLAGMSDADELTPKQSELLEQVVLSLFRIPQAEYTIVGLKSLVDLNRKAVKKVYMELDDKSILNFIKKNKYALGLDDADFSNTNNKWLAMWE